LAVINGHTIKKDGVMVSKKVEKPIQLTTLKELNSFPETYRYAMGLLNSKSFFRLPNNLEADRVLNDNNGYVFTKPEIFWLGTGLIYEAPEKEFKSNVEYVFGQGKWRFIAEIPKRFQGKKDTALVIEQPFWEIDWNSNVYSFKSNPKHMTAVEAFPVESMWALTDPNTGIPSGAKMTRENMNARYLLRNEGLPWVGSLVRGTSDLYGINMRRTIIASHEPNETCSVFVVNTRNASNNTDYD
jgi:hypothetical protein